MEKILKSKSLCMYTGRRYIRNLRTSAQYCCDPKTALKNSLLKTKK